MIDTGSVERALGSLERFTPDEGEVLAGFRRGVARRRRRRQVTGVAGVAGTATAVVVGAVLVLPDRQDEQGGPSPVTAASPSAPAVDAALPAPELPFTVSWLPGGYALARWDVSAAVTYAYYETAPDARTGQVPTIMVGASATRPEDPAGAVAEPATIGGRPGVIQRMAVGTQFRWRLADGSWAVVGTRDATPEAQLRRVAEGVAPQPTPLEFPVGLSRLPEGYRLARSMNQGTGSVTMTLCRTGVDPLGPAGDTCLGVQVLGGAAPAELPQRSGSEMTLVPVDREEVVDGVSTRATADGRTVVAQIGPKHWVEVTTTAGDKAHLRSVAAAAVVTR